EVGDVRTCSAPQTRQESGVISPRSLPPAPCLFVEKFIPKILSLKRLGKVSFSHFVNDSFPLDAVILLMPLAILPIVIMLM
ncbi:hypothetical protein, partial [Nostoc sp.]|uniref:hypothetical protein n=1 Tax=Nostoc sp. TaxID=1180 RepID=UPI002FF79FAE